MSDSPPNSLGANLKGLLKLVPIGSQVVLSLIFTAGIAFALCAAFGEATIGAKNADRLWYLGVACFIFGGIGWLLSRRDQDMAGAHPTTTSIDERGNLQVSADPRVYGFAEVAAMWSTRASGALYARPVVPAGMLDDENQPATAREWNDQAKAQFDAAQQRADEQRAHLMGAKVMGTERYDPNCYESQAVTLDPAAIADLFSNAPIAVSAPHDMQGDDSARHPAI